MICYMCGREIREDAAVCSGCGAQQRRPERPKRDSVSKSMRNEIQIGGKTFDIRKICLGLAASVALLIGFYAAYPAISSFVGNAVAKAPEIISPAVEESASEIDKVSGEILVLTSKISDCAVQSEAAYDDLSWKKSFLVNGNIVVKTLRYTQNEDWINTHVFSLYPDVQNVSAITPAPSYSDCSAIRIRISETSYAPDCTVEVVLVKTEKFDHIFIVEMPNSLFEEYEVWINEWIESLKVVDADVYYSTQNV